MHLIRKLLMQFSFVCFALLCFGKAISQDITITGKVVDSVTRLAIPNASITVKGSATRGIVTDNNGAFKLTVPNNAVLIISSLNYATQEISVGQNTVINVLLAAKVSELNDVVVIGYGTRQRKDLTGAVSTVSAKDIEKGTSVTPELALQGRTAGVFVESGGGDPQSRPLVRIRGVNTFGYAEPLYVVDGVPIYEGGSGITDGAIGDIRSPINIFSMINPQDIESISVLKDASAAAIYGVRASNGVVLITTKRGKTGKPRVEVAASYGMQNIPKTYSVLNTQQYFDLIREAYSRNPDVGTTFEEKFGSLYDAASPTYVGNGSSFDWQKELLNKNAPIQDYSARISGGSEATTYYVSMGYTRQESPLKSNNLERYTVATSIDSRVSRFLSTGVTLRLVKEDALVNTQTDLPTMMTTIPFQPIFDPTSPTGYAITTIGTFEPNPNYDPSKIDAGPLYNFAPGSPTLLWGDQTRSNVYAFQQLNTNKYDLVRTLGNAYVQLELLPGLRLKGSLGGDYYINLRKDWQGIMENWQYSQTPNNPYAGQDGKAVGSYGERQGKTYNLNKELSLTYNHSFGDHNIDVLLNASDQFARWSVSDLSGKVDYTDPQYRNIRNQPPFTNGFSNILTEDQLLGYTGRISYKYSDKYYFDATLRYDGSSRLADGHKWDKFPSFAVAWRISRENFFPKESFVNDLKLRGGWGKLGNFQSAGYYKFLSTISTTPDYALGSGNGDGVGRNQTPAVALPNFANVNLTWEKLKTTSVGLDAVLFDNHLTFTAEYYNKLTYDIIQSVSLTPSTGIEAPADLNIATVRNSGFELQLGYNAKLGDINFNVSGNITTVKNKVEGLNLGNPTGSELARIEEGYPLFYLWGYKVGGVFQTQEEIDAWRQTHADGNLGQNLTDPNSGYNYQPGDMYFQDIHGNPRDSKERFSPAPDSIINSNDRVYLGKTIPGYFYGLNLSANYKGLDLSILFQGVGDVQKYNSIRSGAESMGGIANQLTSVLNRWTSDNHSTSMPRAVYGDPASTGRISDRFVENAGYLRLKNIQLGYSIPKTFLGKLGVVDNFRIYASAINLFTITQWSGLDPENDFVPITRQFVFGINAAF